MPAVDGVQTLAAALTSVITAAAGVQAVCGRATDVIRDSNEPGEYTQPVCAFRVPRFNDHAQTAVVDIYAFAEDDPGTGEAGQAIAHRLLAEVRAALTAPALAAAGIDAVPTDFERVPLDAETEGAPSGALAQLTVTFLVFT